MGSNKFLYDILKGTLSPPHPFCGCHSNSSSSLTGRSSPWVSQSYTFPVHFFFFFKFWWARMWSSSLLAQSHACCYYFSVHSFMRSQHLASPSMFSRTFDRVPVSFLCVFFRVTLNHPAEPCSFLGRSSADAFSRELLVGLSVNAFPRARVTLSFLACFFVSIPVRSQRLSGATPRCSLWCIPGALPVGSHTSLLVSLYIAHFSSVLSCPS